MAQSTSRSRTPVPITVFTGFLGSGKTSVILSLLPRLPEDYKVVLLKNEFGDVEVDSQLAKQSSLTAVSEILNGCMCCILVGQMKTALLEIREKYRPDRIIIETSGSAFPATLAFQIRELERETAGDLKLDAIITVIDAENFTGYEDTSTTARMQAQYSDVLLINKWEHVSDRALDIVMDHLYTLNDSTPKIKCVGRTGVDPALIFGLDTKLFAPNQFHSLDDSHDAKHGHDHELDSLHHNEVETATIWLESQNTTGSTKPSLTRGTLEEALAMLPKASVYRVKGFIIFAYTPESPNPISTPTSAAEAFILNWAFGRFELVPFEPSTNPGAALSGNAIRLTIMGERGEVKAKWARRLADALHAEVE